MVVPQATSAAWPFLMLDSSVIPWISGVNTFPFYLSLFEVGFFYFQIKCNHTGG